MRYLFCVLMMLVAICGNTQSQPFTINIEPTFEGEKLILDHPYHGTGLGTITISMLKFYLSNVAFSLDGDSVFMEPLRYRLIDLADSSSLRFVVDTPSGIDFDEVSLHLGVDSITNVNGALGGDLDPMHGMYWSWQSGYINLKLEGSSTNGTENSQEFTFHLGGYLAPFQSQKLIELDAVNEDPLTIYLDIADLFSDIDLNNTHHLMSPSTETVTLSNKISQLMKTKR